jgi:UDP-N-acetylmuramoylalanine--D-glutamate ligase
MISEQLAREFSGKRILVLGYGNEGQSTCRLLEKLQTHSELAIADARENLSPLHGDTVYSGSNYLEALHHYDFIVRSPGVPLSKAHWSTFGSQITSQVELFLKYFPGTTIGITGTKGKTTTSSLLTSLLTHGDRNPLLMGNIGIPVFDRIDECSLERPVVLELSSHQLQYIRHTPSLSVLLNIYPEHLEYYDSFDDYEAAKLNILAQGLNPSCAFVHDSLKLRLSSRRDLRDIVWVGKQEELLSDFELPPHLQSQHQRMNTLFAVTIARHLGVSQKEIQAGLNSFQGLPFRTEEIGIFAGIHFVNDSASTIPEATMSALQSLSNVATVIIGGMERNVSLKGLVDFLHITSSMKVICMPDTGRTLYRLLQESGYPKDSLYLVESTEEAAQRAILITPKGSTCLFSPAAASYHAYKNFTERGEAFTTAVRSLSNSTELEFNRDLN